MGIPKGTYSDPLVTDLFLLWYERDFKLSPRDVVEAPFFLTNIGVL